MILDGASRRALHLVAGALLAAGTAMGVERPNILWIVGVDLGYRDLGCQGGEVATPAIDSLATEGARCTRGYVTAPVCCPSRAGLLSGRYQQRFGHEFNLLADRPEHDDWGLPVEEVLVPARLKQAGYATGLFGKWHLGHQDRYHPQARGFEVFYGFLGGHHDFASGRRQGRDATQHPWMILRGHDPVPPPPAAAYLTDTLATETSSFLAAQRGRPWFACLSFNAVHAPLQSPTRQADPKAPIEERRAVLREMIASMDRAVGRVLETVRSQGEAERTLVFLISDNGGPTRVTGADNRPLRGEKGSLLEGGIRVPFLVSWPGRIPQRVHESPVIALDIAATTLAAAGASAEGVEGIDLLPALAGGQEGAPRALFWRLGDRSRAICVGGRKLLKQGGPWQFYDLDTDPGEARDLAAERPQEVAELAQRWESWNTANLAPLWKNR
jgi:arylsulfatase A-like enzyme